MQIKNQVMESVRFIVLKEWNLNYVRLHCAIYARKQARNANKMFYI
jgi:hypothetical protein